MESEQCRVMLMVHDLKPPFLDGRENFTTQTKPVQVVRDPTSDFAILAKKGSAILKYVRDKKERAAMREKFWEI
jgi:pre-mRNA-splicing factor ATP-dependent RNA helicase DHX38/PRP16